MLRWPCGVDVRTEASRKEIRGLANRNRGTEFRIEDGFLQHWVRYLSPRLAINKSKFEIDDRGKRCIVSRFEH